MNTRRALTYFISNNFLFWINLNFQTHFSLIFTHILILILQIRTLRDRKFKELVQKCKKVILIPNPLIFLLSKKTLFFIPYITYLSSLQTTCLGSKEGGLIGWVSYYCFIYIYILKKNVIPNPKVHF